MGKFDSNEVLDKLYTAESAEASRRIRRGQEAMTRMGALERMAADLVPPDLKKGMKVFRPVFSQLVVDPTSDDLLEKMTISQFSEVFERTKSGSWLVRIFSARAYPDIGFSMGRPIGSRPVGARWCVAPGTTRGGYVCFINLPEPPPADWTALTIVHISTSPDGQRQTLFAEPVVGSMNGLVDEFGYGPLLKARAESPQ